MPAGFTHLVVAIGLILLVAGRPASAMAQGTAPHVDEPVDVWALTGVDATITERWHATIRLGHLGGFDSYVWLSELHFVLRRELQLTGGIAGLDPSGPGARGTWVTRAGGTWQPSRGRLAVDNRVLAEWRSGASTARRARNRLRLSWAVRDGLPLRLFTTVEGFVASGAGFSEVRYQAGISTAARRTAMEVYWLRSQPQRRTGFDAIGVTAVWRVGRM